MANVLDGIRDNPKPADAASWWSQQRPEALATPLDEEEQAYFDFFRSEDVPLPLRIRDPATVANLTDEERKHAAERFGPGPDAVLRFANYESRRRIIAHYVYTHPATIQYELGLYRLTRDVNPITFIGERIHRLFTGREAFTGDKESRIGAAVDLLIPVVVGGVLKLARAGVAGPVPARQSLSEPLYGLPPRGGLKINGRYYTEHALERMAPDTPQVRAELRARALDRLQRLGIGPESPAYDKCVARALEKIDPRGVPPSVVEAEIARPGSTNVKVITARRGQVVVTVIPKR